MLKSIIFVACFLSGITHAADIWVNDDEGTGCNYSTIQSAIEKSGDGDHIYVRNGIYIENININ